jgi:hypothetical protein
MCPSVIPLNSSIEIETFDQKFVSFDGKFSNQNSLSAPGAVKFAAQGNIFKSAMFLPELMRENL